ncbi:MAG: hypothetical protein LBP87_00510 [Planctomycetaceae bacterium]|jgi:hypothetical protein|nr:hypothetical protein [Planctomycetaceae bacterium]
MINRKRYMPTKDGEFVAWARTIYKDCSENAAIWELDRTQITQFLDLLNTAETAFQANSHLDLRNKVSVIAKNTALLNLKQFLRTFTKLLEGNLKIPDNAIKSMGLRPRQQAAHQPIPIPDDVPVLTAVVGQHHELTVYASTLQHGHPTDHVQTGKYAGFILKYRIEDDPQWQIVLSTKLHHQLLFTETEKRKNIILQAAWLNPRMQNGPWSEEIKELIN